MNLPPQTPSKDFDNYTLHDIEQGLSKLAMIIDTHDQKYLPLFEHLSLLTLLRFLAFKSGAMVGKDGGSL